MATNRTRYYDDPVVDDLAALHDDADVLLWRLSVLLNNTARERALDAGVTARRPSVPKLIADVRPLLNELLELTAAAIHRQRAREAVRATRCAR